MSRDTFAALIDKIKTLIKQGYSGRLVISFHKGRIVSKFKREIDEYLTEKE